MSEEDFLHDAVLFGLLDEVRDCLARGADHNARDKDGDTPLNTAAHLDNPEVVRVLLDAGADHNARDKDGDTPLNTAAHLDNPEVVRVLLASGADHNARDYDGDTPLHTAAASGRRKVVRVLLAAGADPNARDHGGRTPLHKTHLPEVVRELLAAGADLDARDNDGNTPLHKADRPEVVRELLAAGADHNARDYGGDTPLLIAAKRDNPEVVRQLLAAGADHNARDNDGDTPLLIAAKRDNPVIVRVLLDAGADHNARDYDDNTPLQIATSRDNPEVVRVLLDAGAARNTRDSDGETPPAPQKPHRPPKENDMPTKENDMPSTVSIIGEPGSGKSHFATLLYIHLSKNPELDVYCSFQNPDWNTTTNAINLANGIPLAPTPSGDVIHDELIISWSKRSWRKRKKKITIPILDSAGELLQIAMDYILESNGKLPMKEMQERLADSNFDEKLVDQLQRSVFEAHRFCFVVDVARDVKQRRDPVQRKHVAFLQNLKNFREQNDLPTIQDSMLVFTKWDSAKDSFRDILRDIPAEEKGMIVAQNRAPILIKQLTSLPGGDGKNPGVILSSTDWKQAPMSASEIKEKYPNGISEEDQTEYLEGQFETKLLPNGREVPKYDEDQYEQIVDWLKAMI